ncbi:MAG: SH3 domain-containing protein [Pseudomonadota bacterium]
MISRGFVSICQFAGCLVFVMALAAPPVWGETPPAAPVPETNAPNIGVSGLPLPRFVSITSARVNLRVGPGRQYPISWILQRRHLPVEVIGEFEHWRRIREQSGDTGWVHKTMLSGRRTGMVISQSKTGDLIPAYASPGPGKPVLMTENGAIGELTECRQEWCHISFKKGSGWILRDNLWGAYPTEEFD